MNQSRILSSILLAIIFIVGAATASVVSAEEKWFRLKTENFTLISNADQSDMKRVATQLEVFRSVLAQLLPRANIKSSAPNTVLLFKSHDSFRSFKPKYKGKTKDNVGGYFLKGWDENYITLTAEKRDLSPFEIIFHEYVHYVINNTLTNPPVWLNEGLAEYYSTFTILDDEEGKIRIGMPIARHIMTLRNRTFLPLDKLLAVDRSSPEYNESAKAGVFYAESWAFVHYLLNGSQDGKRFPQLTTFLNLLASGMPRDKAFQQAFQSDYKTIEEELRRYISKFAFRVLEGRVAAAANGKSDRSLSAEQLSEVEAQFLLGSLQHRIGRVDEAVERLEKAQQLDASFAPNLIALAAVRIRQDRLAEAAPLLERAIKSDAANYLGHFYYGAMLSEQEKHQEAIGYLKQAALLKPASAWVLSELSMAQLNAGMEKESDAAFAEALRLDTNKESIWHRRAYSSLQLGHGARAAAAAIGYLNRQGWSDNHATYVALVAYFGYRKALRMASADDVLNEALRRSDNSEWIFSVLQYLQGSLTTESLLTKAGDDNDKLTEAHAYVGLDLALKGEREAALSHLAWVKEKGNKNFVEYPLATAELKRIEAAKSASPQ